MTSHFLILLINLLDSRNCDLRVPPGGVHPGVRRGQPSHHRPLPAVQLGRRLAPHVRDHVPPLLADVRGALTGQV